MKENGQGVIELMLIMTILAIIAYFIITALIPSAITAGKGIEDAITVVSSSSSASVPVAYDPPAVSVSNIAIEAPPTVESYQDIPMTQHAKESHSTQLWNATEIRKYFDARGCVPKIDICQSEDFEVHYCEINGGRSIALVVGKTFRQIITGYMAPTSYWENKCP